MVAIGVAIVREGAGQRCREEKWLERPCWWQRRGKDGKADRTNQLPRACPEPEPTCWCRLYLEASSFSSISVTCVVASSMPVPLTGTRHSNQMLTHPLGLATSNALSYIAFRYYCASTNRVTVSDSYRNKCRSSVDTPIHPFNSKKQMEPFSLHRFHTSTHRETQLPRNANFRQCEDLPLSSRSVLMSSCTWGCS